jgi:uncharacterized membrane protein YjjB (DUF3815 family)
MYLKSFDVAAAIAAGVLALTCAVPGSAAPLNDLVGRWSGWGSVTMNSGATEQVKCVATYFVENGGAQMKQNLRCASTSYAAVGSVAGRFTVNGFNVSIQGPAFTAAMAVTTTSCKQSISITPTGFDISRINIGLDKC